MNMLSKAPLHQTLEGFEKASASIRRWMNGRRLRPLPENEAKAILESLDDLDDRIKQWKADPGLLVVVLVGGTGVGKSTILNALAGKSIATAGLVRPTTQTPTIYHHREVAIERLDPRLQHCRAAAHDREELRWKVLVDTPDFDGNVVEHHERLREILPTADAVVFVGSQEKYHDREAWKLLLEEKRTRAFAFVLNKWDRCQPNAGDRSGRSPDVDFRRSLHEAGFHSPLLFRTSASQWAMRRIHGQEPDEWLSDDFEAFEEWLDEGLNEQAIRSIKASGIAGNLDELVDRLDAAVPSDWSSSTEKVKADWIGLLHQSASEQTQALMEAADAHSHLFDAHFRRLDRMEYTGVFGWFLSMVDLGKRLRWSLQPKMPSLSGRLAKEGGALVEWADRIARDTPALFQEDQSREVSRRLLASADRQGWPMEALAREMPEDDQFSEGEMAVSSVVLAEAQNLEKELRSPEGGHQVLRRGFQWSAAWLPWLAFAAVIVRWIYNIAFHGHAVITLAPLVTAMGAMGITLGVLYFIMVTFLPTRWEQLRGRFARDLERRLVDRLSPPFLTALDAFAAKAEVERRELAEPLAELKKLQRTLAASETSRASASMFAAGTTQ
jgi:energy-coupling factor transporter ATP-binding protein EcfA2